jgi:formamidopyrimidine-DNA glycosylase
MPELAEVDYYRKVWNPGLGQRVRSVHVNAKARLFRDFDPLELKRQLTGAILRHSAAHGKQMLFRFNRDLWLGLHLGMTGRLRLETKVFKPDRHDHLVLFQAQQTLVFSDPRLFGRVRFEQSSTEPLWWKNLAPELLSTAFTVEAVQTFFKRRRQAPMKAVLLMQERFPGLGNWMVDEVLWRARIHPQRRAGTLSTAETKTVWKEIRWVSQQALKIIGKDFSDPPKSWLFLHRWKNGGRCPKTGTVLQRKEIGGRTTCWSPAWQPLQSAR